MHALGPTDSLVTWMVAVDRRRAEDRRLSHLVALAEAASSRPGFLDVVRARLLGAGAPPSRVAATCCAA